MASVVGGLLGGATGGVIGGAIVRLILDDRQFTAGLAKARAQTTGFGGKVAGMAPVIARGLAIPAAIAGTAAIKMAVDFDNAFTRISALSNASAQDVERWRDEVKDLAVETARSPQELAEALFFLSSAGLESGQVMEALEASARAAAVGLGETQTIASLVAQALNAYRDSGLTATAATDVLVAAVREGTAETDEFAGAMGRILPIASATGVGFDEIAASLAALSTVGLDVNEGVTAMRGLLQAMAAPTSQAAQELARLGISTETLRETLREGGVLAALELLQRATGGNVDQLRRIIPNIRALTAQLALSGESAEEVAGVFTRVRDSTGSLDKAFGVTAESVGFKFAQAWNRAKTALLDVGEALVSLLDAMEPLLDSAVELVKVLADELGPILHGLTPLLGLVEKAIGSVARAIGWLVRTGLDVLRSGLNDLKWAINSIIPFWDPFGDGAEKAGRSVRSLEAETARWNERARRTPSETARATQALEELDTKAAETTRSLRELRNIMLELQGGALGVVGAVLSLHDAQARLREVQDDDEATKRDVLEATVAVGEAQLALTTTFEDYNQSVRKAGVSTQHVTTDLISLLRAAGATEEQIDAVIATLRQVPKQVRIDFSVPGLDITLSRLRELHAIMARIQANPELNIAVRTSGGVGILGAQGGLHTTLARDTLILAHRGERVDIRTGAGRAPAAGSVTVNIFGDIDDAATLRRFERRLTAVLNRAGAV